jgi:hypothetical protein
MGGEVTRSCEAAGIGGSSRDRLGAYFRCSELSSSLTGALMIVSPFRHLPVTQIQSSLSNRVRAEPDF